MTTPRRRSWAASKPSESASRSTARRPSLARAELDAAGEAPLELGDQIEKADEVAAPRDRLPVMIAASRAQELRVEAGDESLGVLVDVADQPGDGGDSAGHLDQRRRWSARGMRGRARQKQGRDQRTPCRPLRSRHAFNLWSAASRRSAGGRSRAWAAAAPPEPAPGHGEASALPRARSRRREPRRGAPSPRSRA